MTDSIKCSQKDKLGFQEGTSENVKVSVVVPVYNVADFLQQCLESILTQSHRNIEVILINDGSTDKSGDIANMFAKKDARIRVIHKQNEGVSIARNVGMEIATGEYICFADSDDYLEPDYVEYLLNLAVANDAEIALTTKMFTTFYKTPQIESDQPHVCSGEYAAASILYYHIPIGVYCKIFRRDFLEKNVIRFIPEVYIGEGFNFNTAAFQRAEKVVIGHRKIYCYRRDNSASAMTKFALHKAEMAVRAISIIRDNLVNPTKKLLDACDYADWHTHADMYNWMVLANAKNDYPEMYQKCFRKVRSYSFKAFFAPVNKKERFRAFVQTIHPRLLGYLLEFRRWKAKSQEK